MLKKIFWIVVAIYVIVLVLINSHEVTFFYMHGRPINLKLDLILIVSFATGILSILINNFIGRSQQFFSDLLSYTANKKKKKLQGNYEEAVNCIKLKDYKKAKFLLNNYLKEEINNLDAYVHLADIYLKEGAPDDAKEVLKKASVVSKGGVKILNKLCDVYIQSKKLDKAIKTLEEAREKSEDKSFYNKRIYETCIALKDFKKAYELQKQLEDDPAFSDLKEEFLITRYNLALDLIKEGDFGKAEKRLKSVIDDDKNFYGAYVDYAQALFKEGKTKEAVEFLTESYEQTKFPYFVKLIEYIHLAEENPQKALSFYQKLLEGIPQGKQSPQDIVIFALYINVLLKLEMIDFAIKAINDFIDTEVDKRIFHLFLAECYLRHNDYENSAKEFHEFLKARGLHPIAMRCKKCDAESYDFEPVCAKCGSYNTIDYKIS
jgi:tetratricopeptide (TPR) repeat protein